MTLLQPFCFRKRLSEKMQKLAQDNHLPKQLKKKWKVSIAAMIRRAERLDIITKEDYQSLIRIMQRRGQRKEEPLDDVLITASPALLKASVMMLLQENVLQPKSLWMNYL